VKGVPLKTLGPLCTLAIVAFLLSADEEKSKCTQYKGKFGAKLVRQVPGSFWKPNFPGVWCAGSHTPETID
jgi:hypothetical protein